MGFKVTVHKNGAKHGEAHYSSEAVAVGMATKMKNAGANVSVARCNGGGCGCDGMKSNPRRRQASTRAASDSTFALETKIHQTEAALPAARLRAAREESGWSGSGMVMATRSEMEAYLRELRRALKSNPRRRNGESNEEVYWEGVLADLARLAKEEKEASKARARRSYSPHTKEEMARVVALDMDAPRRRNGESSDHTASPLHAVLEAYGWVYSHSTPMHRPGGVVTTRHSYGFPSDAAGKKYPRVGFDGSRWSGSMGGSGSEVTGRSAADLAKYLKGARSRGAKKNPRRNGTTSANAAASRSMAYTHLFR